MEIEAHAQPEISDSKRLSSPVVSIIMNCYNSAKYLREAINSVYAQTYKDWEIIFWDNASCDESGLIAKSYGNGKLKYFRSKETVPLSIARNWALGKAQGKYIAFLDCDDKWLPEKLVKQIPLFEADKRIGLVYCNTLFFNDKGKRKQLYKRRPPEGNIFRQLLSNYFLSMETVVIRTEALMKLDEWFDKSFVVSEEADLFMRLVHDWQVRYVSEPLAMCRVHSGRLTFTNKALFPKEWARLLDKFRRIYSQFDSVYSQEVSDMECRAEYLWALLDWERGNSTSVRKRLKPYLAKHNKYIMPYLFSYLPLRFYKLILSLRSLQI